ncbi:MAG: aminotransferase class I/II-fold pyridoxal phosphate-dependent enzyme [Pseudomonadota bacterium]
MSELHGALNATELSVLGIDPRHVLDFSSNCLPGHAHAQVRQAARNAAVETYPSPDAAPLRAQLAHCHGVAATQIVAGGGAAQLIYAAVQAYSREGDAVLSVQPSFGEYLDAAKALRRRAIAVPVSVDADPDLAELFEAVERERPALVCVCQPNNPTGRLWPDAQVRRLAAVCRERGARLLLDHAYRSFVDPISRFDGVKGAINLYSLTKDYALAGLRLGYVVTNDDDARSLQRVLPPWSVSAPATAAGCAALEPDVVVSTDAAIYAIRTSAAALWSALRERGARVLSSDCHFALIEQPKASAFRLRMLQQTHIQVRSAASFGLPDHIRVCSKGAAADARLLQAWDAVSVSLSTEL